MTTRDDLLEALHHLTHTRATAPHHLHADLTARIDQLLDQLGALEDQPCSA